MGKYGIGTRVRDDGGDEGVIVEKSKGRRLVEYDYALYGKIWNDKCALTALPAANDNLADPVEAVEAVDGGAWVPKVGDRVRFKIDNPNGGGNYGRAGQEFDVTSLFAPDAYGSKQIKISHSSHPFEPAAPISVLEPVVAPATTALQVEAGKFYRTRDGRKVGPMISSAQQGIDCVKYPWAAEGDYDLEDYAPYWRNDGSFSPYGKEHGVDLVAEWVEPEPVAAPVEVAVAEATATLKVGDKVQPVNDRYGWVTAQWDAYWKADEGAAPRGEFFVVETGAPGVTISATLGGNGPWWPAEYFELVQQSAPPEPAVPPAKFNVGDRVLSAGNTWSKYRVLACDADGVDVINVEKDGSESTKWRGQDLKLFSLDPEFVAPTKPTFPIGATVTFTATGRVSAINENGHVQVTFPDLLPGQNSFALPAKYVGLAN